MQQRVREPYRGSSPSSARQLPILAALDAGSPTLFGCIIHDMEEKVNTQITNIEKFLSIFPGEAMTHSPYVISTADTCEAFPLPGAGSG